MGLNTSATEEIEGETNSLAAHAIALVLEQYRWYRNA